MNPDSRIYIAGHRGLAGSAIQRSLAARGYSNLITRTHSELDLCNPVAVNDFFSAQQPEFIFLAAAKVGGIHANQTFPVDFLRINLEIQSNVIDACHKFNVKRLLFLGSSCIYPRDCPQPIREEYLLTGPLESTNRPYAIAKIAGIELCWAYNRQFRTQFLAAMPTNLYGPGDNYNLENSHVLPALIRKVYEAKRAGKNEYFVWGTGKPKREFLFSDDFAEACLHLMELDETRFQSLLSDDQPPIINIGSGTDISIKELAETVCRVLDFSGALVFDSSKPDGTPRKLMDSSRINALGWAPRIDFEQGLKLTFNHALPELERLAQKI